MMTVTDRDDVRLFLQDILHRIERFELTHELGVEDLFTTRFMHEHSAFDSFDEMVTAAGVVIVRSIAELETNDQWQRFISGRTTFETWDQMREEAARAWIANELGLTQSEPGAAPWQRHLPSLPAEPYPAGKLSRQGYTDSSRVLPVRVVDPITSRQDDV